MVSVGQARKGGGVDIELQRDVTEVMMKLVRFFLITAILTLVYLHLPEAEAVDLVSIDDKMATEFQNHFAHGKAPSLHTLTKKPAWSCQVYGMRSRLQTTVKSSFYKFSLEPAPLHPILKNKGSQTVSTYSHSPLGVIGQNSQIKDAIRVGPSGQLVSEISAPIGTPDERTQLSAVDSRRAVIAYSVCN